MLHAFNGVYYFECIVIYICSTNDAWLLLSAAFSCIHQMLNFADRQMVWTRRQIDLTVRLHCPKFKILCNPKHTFFSPYDAIHTLSTQNEKYRKLNKVLSFDVIGPNSVNLRADND